MVVCETLGDITNTIASPVEAGKRREDIPKLPLKDLLLSVEPTSQQSGVAQEPSSPSRTTCERGDGAQTPRTPKTVPTSRTRTPVPARTPVQSKTPASARGMQTATNEREKPRLTRAASASQMQPGKANTQASQQERRAAVRPTLQRSATAVGMQKSASSTQSRKSAEEVEAANALLVQETLLQEAEHRMAEVRHRVVEARKKEAELQRHLQVSTEELQLAVDGHREHVAAQEALEANLRPSLESMRADLEKELAKEKSMTAAIEAKGRVIERCHCRIGEVEDAMVSMNEKEKEKVLKADLIRAKCSDAQADLERRKETLVENIVHNRRLHNEYLSLKGNIRVFCRLRPQLPGELEGDALKVELQNDHAMVVQSAVQKNVTGMRDVTNSLTFDFDHIFAQDAKQAGIFEEIAPLVQSALDGYRVAIFAYGQTGSGKTYTMDGPQQGESATSEEAGIIPRTVDLIFSEMKEMKERGWSFEVHITMMEVYNEGVIDLLAPKSGAATPRECEGATARDASCSHEAAAEQYRHVRVESASAVHHFLHRAARDRHVAATACNDRSSRSHAVFQLALVGRCRSGNEGVRQVEGLLSLVDLAGSERVEKSQATGDRLREAQHINRSLSALGDVVEALARRGPNGSKHVPYRNSKLTMLLKDSLGGDSKALMFVNISMCNEHFGETISSLRFAAKVHACNVGVAKRVAASGSS